MTPPRPGHRARRWWVLSPTLGIGLFGLLYVVAACQYPGGATADHTTVGFSWRYNYWCDLLGAVGKNGQHNPARPVALTAMLVLGVSISAFWWLVPRLHVAPNRYVRVSRWAGALAIGILFFIGTPYHDLVMNVAGIITLLPLSTTFVGLYRQRNRPLLAYGLVCLLLVGLNNYVYYSQHYVAYLPVLQKVSFVVVLGWFVAVNRVVYQRHAPARHP